MRPGGAVRAVGGDDEVVFLQQRFVVAHPVYEFQRHTGLGAALLQRIQQIDARHPVEGIAVELHRLAAVDELDVVRALEEGRVDVLQE
jgi:hypothetical protein